MKIAMVSSEANPFIKTGGLGDVVYSLAKELTILGEEVFVILPFYKSIKNKINVPISKTASFHVRMSWRTEEAIIYHTYVNGISYFLIDNEHYFGRNVIYGEYDDGERFAFFTLAARKMFEVIKLKPDIIHIHDWQPGMLPVLVKEDTDPNNYLKDVKFVLTIHNPAFQGLYSKVVLGDFYGLPDTLFDNGKVRFKEQVSTLKSAIIYSDKITTVSPTHREELLTPEGGMGLEQVLRLREWDFIGILNGVDYLEFNPKEDDYIVAPYDINDFRKQKLENRKNLLNSMHLDDTGKPLFGIVSRLTWQKGMDLFFAMAYELANRECNIVILGSGEYFVEQRCEELRAKYPKTVGIYIGYNDELAHKIYAACDFFLMPSLFEPCGIGQMIAQRYGALPIVRRTGGLKDSVINYDGTNEDRADGFGFDAYDTYEAVRTAVYAYDTWWNLPVRKKLMENAMKVDHSWQRSATEYEKVYQTLLLNK